MVVVHNPKHNRFKSIKKRATFGTGTPGILVHYFPKDESLRQKWTQFVRTHRKDFEPKNSSCLCSAHFDDSCFERKPVFHGEGSGEAVEMRKLLIKGSVSSKNSDVPNTSPITKRKRRRVRFTTRGLRL